MSTPTLGQQTPGAGTHVGAAAGAVVVVLADDALEAAAGGGAESATNAF